MPRPRRGAAKVVRENTSVSNENVAASAAATALSKGKKRTLDTVDPTLQVAQATIVNPPSKKPRKGAGLTRAKKSGQNQSARVQRERVDTIDNNQSAQRTSSVNPPPLDPAPHDSAPHDDISSGSDTENNNSDSSEIEAEPEWADNPQEVQPVIQVTSKRSALVQNERPSLHGLVHTTGNASSSLSRGDEIQADNRPLVGSSHATGTTVSTASNPIWPPDTNLVIVPGAHVKLSQQSLLIKVICRDAFDNVRTNLLFDCAFPPPKAIPNMVRMCLANSIRDCTVWNGHYNASAACVHQRLLTDVDYDAKLGRLVRARIPIFRGEVKERCAQLVEDMFSPLESPAEAKELADQQLDNYNYTYQISAPTTNGRRSKLYRNERIVTVIRDLFFTGGNLSYAHRFDIMFPRFQGPDGVFVCEMPEPMLGLVATGLFAAIHDWRTGRHTSTDFSADTFMDVYDGHVLTLNTLRAQHPRGFHKLMADLYNLASVDVVASTIPVAHVDFEEFDG